MPCGNSRIGHPAESPAVKERPRPAPSQPPVREPQSPVRKPEQEKERVAAVEQWVNEMFNFLDNEKKYLSG